MSESVSQSVSNATTRTIRSGDKANACPYIVIVVVVVVVVVVSYRVVAAVVVVVVVRQMPYTHAVNQPAALGDTTCRRAHVREVACCARFAMSTNVLLNDCFDTR